MFFWIIFWRVALTCEILLETTGLNRVLLLLIVIKSILGNTPLLTKQQQWAGHSRPIQ